MEAGIKRVFSDAVIGKLLIQTNPHTGDPEVLYICTNNEKILIHHLFSILL
jgi:hypothetical protein